MNRTASRRQFLRTTLAAAPALAMAPATITAAERRSFSFVLLGDLHYDKPSHHDLAWMKANKPDDVRQMENYSRITHDVTPLLFKTVRETIADLNKSAEARAAFVLQVGDVVEGLCGSEELSTRQNHEALAFVRDANLGVPFLFTKGNHDVTGPGAPEAFGKVFHPFLTEQARRVSPNAAEVKSARYTVDCGAAQFAFFDAYDRESLEWFEPIAAARKAEHFFTVIHPPVVPYGARSTWNIFSGAKDKAKREKLLSLLAKQRAYVLGGHIHRFNSLTRAVGSGRFVQLAVSSIINAPDVQAKDLLTGAGQYNADQIRVEPNHSPGTEQERRAVYDAERAFVKSFEYADLPGYAVVTVNGANVTAKIYSGVSRNVWRTVELSRLLSQA